MVATAEAHRVVDGKPGVLPAQQGLGERLGDEVELQEQADGAPAQALGHASRVVNGQVVELPGGVESTLQDKGVEMRVEPQRVAEGLVGHDGGGCDRLASRGGVELCDQVEYQPCKVGEEALVMAQKNPQGFGQREDELAVGEGKEQLLIEVLREQQSPLLTARRAKEEPLAGERTEVLVAAFGVGTSDAGYTLSSAPVWSPR